MRHAIALLVEQVRLNRAWIDPPGLDRRTSQRQQMKLGWPAVELVLDCQGRATAGRQDRHISGTGAQQDGRLTTLVRIDSDRRGGRGRPTAQQSAFRLRRQLKPDLGRWRANARLVGRDHSDSMRRRSVEPRVLRSG